MVKTKTYTCKKYKGLWIYENYGDTIYYSCVNPKIIDENGKNPHTHGVSWNQMIKVANCYHEFTETGMIIGKYSRSIRNKALMLAGLPVAKGL